MFPLLLLFAFIFAGLAVIIAAAGRWGQGYFYERPVDGLAWRATAVAGGVTAFLGLWAFIEAKSPGRFDSLFSFSSREEKEFDRFWSERKTSTGVTETEFRRHTVPPGRFEYVDDAGRPWKRSDSGIVTAIIVEEDNGEQRRRFVAQLGPDGNFLRDPSDPNKAADVRYVEEGGRRRVMTESTIGRLSYTRYGPLVLNWLFNLVFVLLWFAGLWLLLEFQWPHAALLAVIFWLASVLFLWPAVQGKLADVATAGRV